ncbi:MAG: hemolysin family protein [Proteobacteria bacterium]|nr:HlyC/CorC family transporter [Desulfobulbaceae bacterium]MBU4153647.1 hemolysin family protein [Pseudomonadota bacterium]
MDSEEHPSPNLSLVRRLLTLIGLAKAPDTTEDLEQEIQEILEDGREQGLITSQEGMMINSIFDLRDTKAKEIMTPVTDMVCAPNTATISELVALIVKEGFTRVPIYTGNSDRIIGILHAKDLLRYANAPGTNTLPDGCIKQPLFILENHRIGLLLRDFKAKQIHMAIVIDEFGSVRGLVTLEDVIEEIVGEINDEHDIDPSRWRVIDAHTVQTDAKVDIEEVETFFAVTLPEGPYESIGGLVIHQLGHIPRIGEFIEICDLTIQVLSATKRRISSLKISRPAPPTSQES